MTDKLTDGGPAFPHDKYLRAEDGQWGTYAHGGMSLRDWFAGQALTGIFSACLHDTRGAGQSVEEMLAEKAFRIADAMLAAGAK